MNGDDQIDDAILALVESPDGLDGDGRVVRHEIFLRLQPPKAARALSGTLSAPVFAHEDRIELDSAIFRATLVRQESALYFFIEPREEEIQSMALRTSLGMSRENILVEDRSLEAVVDAGTVQLGETDIELEVNGSSTSEVWLIRLNVT